MAKWNKEEIEILSRYYPHEGYRGVLKRLPNKSPFSIRMKAFRLNTKVKPIDLSGKIFGKLKVIKFAFVKNHKRYFLCKCECGKLTNIRGEGLKYRKSCGCSHRLHRQFHHNFKGYKDISSKFFSTIKINARNAKRKFNITIKQIWNLFIKQDKRCALSGVELFFSLHSRDYNGTASLDRIDSNKGYTLDNIQWIHKDINFMKQELDEKKFIDWCYKISQYNKTKGKIK